MLALGDVALVSEDKHGLKHKEDHNDDHEDNADLALGAVLDLGRSGVESVVGVGATNSEKDNGNQHQQLDGALVDWLHNDMALAVHGVEGAAQEAQQCKDERTQANAIESEPANVEASVAGIIDSGEEEGRSYETGERENDEIEPAGVSTKAMVLAENESADEDECVDGNLSNGDVVVVVERASHDGG